MSFRRFLRDGLEGKGFKSVFSFYLFGVFLAAPAVALWVAAYGKEAGLSVTPMTCVCCFVCLWLLTRRC